MFLFHFKGFKINVSKNVRSYLNKIQNADGAHFPSRNS